MYAELISQKSTLNGERFESINYADDKMLIAETPQKLQMMVNALNITSLKYGTKINCNKTKVMKIERKKDNRPLKIKIEGTQLEQVEWYKYLGHIVTEDGRDDPEIKVRIAMARSAFNNMERVLRARDLHMESRLRILNCYV